MTDATFWLGVEGNPLLILRRDDGDERLFYDTPHLNGDIHYWLVGHEVTCPVWYNPEVYGLAWDGWVA